MNSYFASVEQQANPFLRGKSVGVCAYLSERGTIIASSKEAKKKGIKTGCLIWQAKILDPKIILIENEPAKYRSTSEKIFKILNKYTDTFEAYSIDEAFLDLSGWVRDFESAYALAQKIKDRIKSEVGEWMEASVGIASTKFLAKFAGDIAPKKSILVITKSNLEEILEGRALTDAWGINKKTEEKLKLIGINNLLDLKNANPIKLKSLFGLSGYYLWANVNGIEISEIKKEESAPKSIGHSYSLKKGNSNRDYLLKVFYKLSEKTGRRLRSLGLEAEGIRVGLVYFYGKNIYKSFKTREKIFTTKDIFKYIENFLTNELLSMPIKTISISVDRLSSISGQMDIFNENTGKKNLSLALDKINDKYGEYTVCPGEMFGMKDAAQDRIGFRKTTLT